MKKKESKKIIQEIHQILEKKYANKVTEEPKSVLSQLIFSIIARNFSRKGAEKAFQIFQQRFVDWNEVRISSVSEIAEVLDELNAPNIEKKAKNIKKILMDIYSDYHKISLEFVKSYSSDKTRKVLQGIRGISQHVMDSVLLFALDNPVVPVLSPLARVIRRLGFIEMNASQAEIKNKLEDLVHKSKIERFARLVIHHGETVCKLQKPECKKCILVKKCNYNKLPKSRKTQAFIKKTETLDIEKIKEYEQQRLIKVGILKPKEEKPTEQEKQTGQKEPKTPAKKKVAVAKKSPTKKPTTKKAPVTKKPTTKKTESKKAEPKKTVVTKKSPAKKTEPKTPAKKKEVATKKSAAKKTTTKKATTSKKTASKNTSVKKKTTEKKSQKTSTKKKK